MPASIMSEVSRIELPPKIITSTLNILREFGKLEVEGLVLWIGQVEANRAHVLHVVVPDQRSMSSEEGLGYFVEGETLFELNKALAESGLRLIAQVHSHPGDAYHSKADDRYAIVTSEGGLSLVVPDFGNSEPDIGVWAVYRLQKAKWEELSGNAVRELFHVVEAE
jgi:hypothetical protein